MTTELKPTEDARDIANEIRCECQRLYGAVDYDESDRFEEIIESFRQRVWAEAIEAAADYLENHAPVYGCPGRTTIEPEKDETIQSDRFLYAQKLRDLKKT